MPQCSTLLRRFWLHVRGMCTYVLAALWLLLEHKCELLGQVVQQYMHFMQ
jgi:hypothetical protein